MSGADFMTKPKHNIRVKRAQDPSSKGAARSVGACAFYSSAVRKATPYVSPEISVTRPVTPWDGGEGKNPHKVTVNTKRKPPLWATWQYTCYRWDAGWNVLGEYDQGTDASTYFDLGARNKTLAHRGMATLAEIDGANPSTGTTRYYAHDHLGSARALYSSAKAELGTLEYNPYGDTYASSGTQPAYSFTGKPYDASIGMYYFPYRYYSPEMDRWISRDPLGMVDGPNLYGYLRGSALASIDKLGREACTLAICGTIWGTCAIADGPLPIGDIIGGCIFAGGMIWAATRPDEWTETVGMPERLPPFVPDPMTSCISGCKIGLFVKICGSFLVQEGVQVSEIGRFLVLRSFCSRRLFW